MMVKITLYWDNGSIESFNTQKSCIKDGSGWIVIEDAGTRKNFNLHYIRRVDVVEM